jgi:hypothetical protein
VKDYKDYGLDQTDLDNLQKIAESPEWTSLTKLFREMDRVATEQLIASNSGENFFERRGYVLGIRKGKSIADEIYSNTHGAIRHETPITSGSRNGSGNGIRESESRSEFRSVSELGIVVPTNPADQSTNEQQY